MSMNTPYGSLISTKKIQDFESVNSLNLDQNILAVKNVVDNAGIKITLQNLLNSIKSSQDNNALQIGSDNKLFVKNLQGDINNRADLDLSNISQAGVNKIKQEAQTGIGEALDIQNMYMTGSLSTDVRGFEQIKEMKRSTFDRSKFTVVGSPTITGDGVASGFSASNYIRISNIDLSKPFKIREKIKTGTLYSQFHYGCPFCLTNQGGWHNYIQILNTSTIGYYFKFSDGTTARITVANTTVPNTEYEYEFSWDGSVYSLKLFKDNVQIGTPATYSSSLSLYNSNNSDILLGVMDADKNTYVLKDGSIDLSKFSIEVYGIEVFNGNKTGIDQIKKDDYTVVGTPTITDDGIASGFSGSNYIKSNTFTLGISNWKVIIEHTTPNSISSATQRIAEFGTDDRFLYYSSRISYYLKGANNEMLLNASFTPTASTSYLLSMEYTNGTYYAKYSTDGENWTTVASNTSSELVNINSVVSYCKIGDGYFSSPLLGGSIDLNAFKIYVDDQLAYQPTLRIPYTQSKTGSKIVNTTYRDRVQDMYEQLGYAPYYTLSETDFTLPMGEIYGMLERKTDHLEVDGQWISSSLVLSTTTTLGTYTFDLSNYLPADNYNYEIIIRGYLNANSTTQTWQSVQTTLLSEAAYLNVCRSDVCRYSASTITIPIGINRQLTYQIKGGALSNTNLELLAYRRVGTNK